MLKRISLIAIYQISALSVNEKMLSKPFNPILGETYELTTDKFEYLAEQVSHHPPVCAVHVKGK